MGCDGRVRLFADREVVCDLDEGHEAHHTGVLRDYAYAGSRGTVVDWYPDDRRAYWGEWPGRCEAGRCVLPAGHRGGHAA